MPSRPPDSDWNFRAVFDLINYDNSEVSSPPTLRSVTSSPVAVSTCGMGLGDFAKLYETLGISSNSAASVALPPLDDSELSTSDDALVDDALLSDLPLPSAVVASIEEPIKQASSRPLLPELPPAGAPPVLTKKQRRKARRRVEAGLQEQTVEEDEQSAESQGVRKNSRRTTFKDAEIAMKTPTKPTQTRFNVGAKGRPTSSVLALEATKTPDTAPHAVSSKQPALCAVPVTPQFKAIVALPTYGISAHSALTSPALFQNTSSPQHLAQFQVSQATTTTGSSLVPRTVRPVIVARQSHPTTSQQRIPTTPSPYPQLSDYITPLANSRISIRSQTDRHMHLFEKLFLRFTEDRKWLVAPRQLVNENTSTRGIHVFVDASNIMYGFRDMLRTFGVQPYDMSFDSLALLMERRRPVAKRIFVGSHREAHPLPQITKLVETSKAVGYECNVQEQVYIAREETEKKRFFNDVNRIGWQKAIQKRSGSGSDSETGSAAPKTPSAPKWVEQGVDELLHLKMCQSILDTEVPSTMVLATGDGAEAEMSDGFLAHVERAMKKGWKVELVTWRQQTNGGYRRRAFRQKWGEQFTITELDEFLEDLIDTP